MTTAIVSTSGAVITGISGMFFTASQLGKLAALDSGIAKLIDRRNPQ